MRVLTTSSLRLAVSPIERRFLTAVNSESPLDALRGPFGLDLRARDAPHFLGIGLERRC